MGEGKGRALFGTPMMTLAELSVKVDTEMCGIRSDR